MAEKIAKLHDVDTEVLNAFPSFSANEPFIWSYIDTLMDFIREKLPKTFDSSIFKQLYGSIEDILSFVAEIRENLEKYKHHPACSLSLSLMICTAPTSSSLNALIVTTRSIG